MSRDTQRIITSPRYNEIFPETNLTLSRAGAGDEHKELMQILKDIRKELNGALINEYHGKAKKALANDGISDWIAHIVDYMLDS